MASPSSASPLILVVDDSEVVLTVTRAVLETAGYRVITHPGPNGCVAVILQEKPDLVLIDVNMPKLGGETIVKLFGKAQPNSETIVLLYSTLQAEQLREKANASGAHGFIRKTDDTYELVRQVGRWLRRPDGQWKPPSGEWKSPSGEWRGAAAPASSTRARDPAGAAAAPARAGEASRPASRASGTERLLPVVLFIDDDMDSLSSFRREIQSEPYRAEFALSTTQALRHILSDSPPDLIVLAPEVGNWSGRDVFDRAIAAAPGTRQRFVLILPRDQGPGLDALLADFGGPVLHRPVDGNALREAIRRAFALDTAGARRTSRG